MRAINKWIHCQDCVVKRVPGGMLVAIAESTASTFVPCNPDAFLEFIKAHDVDMAPFEIAVPVAQKLVT